MKSQKFIYESWIRKRIIFFWIKLLFIISGWILKASFITQNKIAMNKFLD